MSPILYNSVKNYKWGNVEYNTYKIEVFFLGVCFMIASCLEFEERIILKVIKEAESMKEMNKTLNKYLSKNFRQKYINILFQMLQIEEDQRPDFIDSLIKYNLCINFVIY